MWTFTNPDNDGRDNESFRAPSSKPLVCKYAGGHTHPPGHIGCSVAVLRHIRTVVIEATETAAAFGNEPISTTKSVAALVKEETKDLTPGHQAYINVFASEEIGPPNIFVSHSWSNDFLAVVDAVLAEIDARFETDPCKRDAARIYFDILCTDQNAVDQVSFCSLHYCDLRC